MTFHHASIYSHGCALQPHTMHIATLYMHREESEVDAIQVSTAF